MIALNSSGDLFKINSDDGKIAWSLQYFSSSHASDFFKSSEIVIDENNIIFSSKFSTFSYDLNNGYLIGEKKLVLLVHQL